jgi:hypothetical protein
VGSLHSCVARTSQYSGVPSPIPITSECIMDGSRRSERKRTQTDFLGATETSFRTGTSLRRGDAAKPP